MIDLTLSKANDDNRLDIVVVNGALQTVENNDELRQRVEFKLEFFQNDWFLDLGFGIPYYGRVFQRGVNLSDLYGVFSLAIETEPGIAQVTFLDLDIDRVARRLTVTGTCESITAQNVEFSSITGEII